MTITELYYLIEGFAVAFFAVMAIQNLYNRDNRIRMILCGILLYWAVQHFLSIIFTSDILVAERYLSRLINTVDMTAAPTCCFLLMELCRPGWLTWNKVVIHEMPFVILGLAYAFSGNGLFYYSMLLFFVFYGTGVFIATLHFTPIYHKFLREHYSYDENINIRWIYIALVTFYGLMFLYAACGTYDTIVGDMIYLTGSIASWAWICFCVSRQQSVLFELSSMQRESMAMNSDNNGDDGSAAERMLFNETLAENIAVRFIEPQLFLDPHLNLGDMANAVGTNRTYLSRYLNEMLQTSFYAYVNSLRLEYALRLMDDKKYSLTSISALAGFNSYSTFRRVFISKYGVSPQQYKR